MRRYAALACRWCRRLGARCRRRTCGSRGASPNGTATGAAGSPPSRAGGVCALRHARRAARSCGAGRARRSRSSSRGSAAFSAEPRPDPLLLISGGPGQSTVDFYLQMRGAFEPARRDRDLILVDQRGTGRSAEGFACDVPDDLSLDTAAPEELSSVIDACVARARSRPALLYDFRGRRRISSTSVRRSASSSGTSTACRTARASRSTTCAGTPSACARSCSTASCRRRSRSDPTSRARRSARSSRSSRAARPTSSAAHAFAALPQLFAEVLARLDAGAADETDPPPISSLELRTLCAS